MESKELPLRNGLIKTNSMQKIYSCKKAEFEENSNLDLERRAEKLLDTLEILEEHKKSDDSSVIRALKFLIQGQLEKNIMYSCYMKVWYLCPNGYSEEVQYLIQDLLYDERVLFMTEPCGLAEALKTKGTDVENRYPHAWLELDNGFFLSVDDELFTCFIRNMESISGV
jgi:hypothetical protein